MKALLKYLCFFSLMIVSCEKEGFDPMQENILIPFNASFDFTYNDSDIGTINFKTDSLGISVLNNKLLAFGTPGYYDGGNYIYSHLTLNENDVLEPFLLHKDVPNQLYIKTLGLKLFEKSGQIDFAWTKDRYDEIFIPGNVIDFGESNYELKLYFIQLGVIGASYREVSKPLQNMKMTVMNVEPYDFGSTTSDQLIYEGNFSGYAVTFSAETIEMEPWFVVNNPASEIKNFTGTFYFPFTSHNLNPDLLLPDCTNDGATNVENLETSTSTKTFFDFNDGSEMVYVDADNNEIVFGDKEAYTIDQSQIQTEVLCLDGVHPYTYQAKIDIQKLTQSEAPNLTLNFRAFPQIYNSYAYSYDRFAVEVMDGSGSPLANLSLISDYKGYENDLASDAGAYQGSTFINSIELNGSTYTEVYEGRDNTGQTALYFSTQNGVIAFKDGGGKWWYFDRKQ